MFKKRFIILPIFVFIFCGFEYVKNVFPGQKTSQSKQFDSMLNKRGGEYRNIRKKILSMAAKDRSFLESKNMSSDKKEKLLARIMLKRMDNPEFFASVDKIMIDAQNVGTRKGPDDISYLYIRSRMLKLKDNPALPAIEHLIYESDDPALISAILQAVYIFKDESMEYCFDTLLKRKDHAVRMSVIDAIQRAKFTKLKPKIKALQSKTSNAKEKQRIKRALSIMK